MPERPRLVDIALERQKARPAGYVPTFVIRTEPWPKVFLQNFVAFVPSVFRRPVNSLDGEFWPDVFVASRRPWAGFFQSFLIHAVACLAVYGFMRLRPLQTIVSNSPVLAKADVIYYEPTEYLAPLNTSAEPVSEGKGDPVYAPQAVISVPPDSDNRSQTIVTPAPPSLKLAHEVPLPNIVAWSRPAPEVPIASTVAAYRADSLTVPVVAPVPEVKAEISRAAKNDPETVVAPPPEIQAAALRQNLTLAQGAVVEPAPQMPVVAVPRTGDLTLSRSVVAPAPELSAGGGSARRSTAPAGTDAAVVPPPPAVQANGDGRLIALGIHPAAARGAVEAPAGNRRGTFAATPEGKAGASGTPDLPGSKGAAGAGGNSARQGIPPGLFVGAAPKTASNAPFSSRTLADATSPRVGVPAHRATSDISAEKATDVERRIFGERRFYSMTLNMPNLNSSSGSWIIHFAELNDNGGQGDLSAPSAVQEVDPGYPLELMRHNVHGTVTLYAVIQADGTVGKVRVLNSIDERLDQYACDALARWRFHPATKDGSPVALEAVVMIPFRPLKTKPAF